MKPVRDQEEKHPSLLVYNILQRTRKKKTSLNSEWTAYNADLGFHTPRIISLPRSFGAYCLCVSLSRFRLAASPSLSFVPVVALRGRKLEMLPRCSQHA